MGKERQRSANSKSRRLLPSRFACPVSLRLGHARVHSPRAASLPPGERLLCDLCIGQDFIVMSTSKNALSEKPTIRSKFAAEEKTRKIVGTGFG